MGMRGGWSTRELVPPDRQTGSRRRTSGRAATLNGQAALRWLARRRCVSLLRSNGSNGRWPPFARRGSKGCMRSATVPSSTPPTVPRELDLSLFRELERVVDLDP